MKISKLFHWLYAILMLLPFGLVVFNCLHGLFSPSATSIDLNTYIGWIENYLSEGVSGGGVWFTVNNVFVYLFNDIFGYDFTLLENLLTYWTCMSIIWLVFDVFMYVPLLVHRWIDKAKLE